MILGEPIFPGESALDQLVEIIKVLGTPTPEQVLQMNPNSDEFKFPSIRSQAWNNVKKNLNYPNGKVLRNSDSLIVDLISKVLVYNPKERLKPLEALAHPVFNDLRSQTFQIQECKIPDLFNFTTGNNN